MSIIYVDESELEAALMLSGDSAFLVGKHDVAVLISALEEMYCPPEILAELREWAKSPLLYELLK